MITYPLAIPGPIYPASADLKKFDAIAEHISPFSGTAEQQQFQDQHWELDLEWPPMSWAQFAAVDAFSAALHGKLGSFYWGPPLALGPRGLGNFAGSPVATGADAGGSNLLHTSGWLPNQNGVLLPGDFLGFALSSAALNSVGVPSNRTVLVGNAGTLPSWATVGTSVFISGTGLADGGPFVLIFVIQNSGSWTAEFYDPGATVGSGTVGSMSLGSATKRLYQYANPLPLNTDGGGNATLDIFPSLREPPPAGAPLILNGPLGTFRLAENRRSAPSKKNKTFTFAMKCREAI